MLAVSMPCLNNSPVKDDDSLTEELDGLTIVVAAQRVMQILEWPDNIASAAYNLCSA